MSHPNTTVPVYDPAWRDRRVATLEVAPGRTVADLPLDIESTRVGIVDWLPQGGGLYKPVVRIHERMIVLKRDTPRKLGMGVSDCTLRRLIRAGFLRGAQPSPSVTMLDLHSWFDHLARVQADPEFWDCPKRRLLYQQSI